MKSRAQTPRLSVAARRQIILVDVRPAYGSIITFSLADSRNAIVQSIRAVCTLTRTLIFILLLFWITASKQALILRVFTNKIICKIVEFSLNLDLILMRYQTIPRQWTACTIKFCTCWWKSATNTSTSSPRRTRWNCYSGQHSQNHYRNSVADHNNWTADNNVIPPKASPGTTSIIFDFAICMLLTSPPLIFLPRRHSFLNIHNIYHSCMYKHL